MGCTPSDDFQSQYTVKNPIIITQKQKEALKEREKERRDYVLR